MSNYYSSDSDMWAWGLTILGLIIFMVIWGGYTTGIHNQEATWLEAAPPGSHIEYYSDSPYNSEYTPNKPKVIFPDGRAWYPDRDACPVSK